LADAIRFANKDFVTTFVANYNLKASFTEKGSPKNGINQKGE